MKLFIVFIFAAVFYANCSDSSGKFTKVRLESCPGCSLNRLPEVRKFFYEDVPLYEEVEWKKISGAKPIAIFLDDEDREIERHSLSDMSRQQCNDLLQERGFHLTTNKEL